MKKIVHLIILVVFTTQLPAQNFTGQWKGEFIDNSTSFTGWGGDRCEYVLEIECRGTKVTGYSYTYFSEGGKRYYTICKLDGKLNKASKYIEIKEVERTKTNVPVNIRNCFQVHRLTYFKTGDDQILEGTWVPVPDQSGDCGFGSTSLSRRVLQKNPSFNNNTVTKNNPGKSKTFVEKKTEPVKQPPTVKSQPIKKKPADIVNPQPTIKGSIKTDILENVKPEELSNKLPVQQPTEVESALPKSTDTRYKKRDSDLIKTIEIDYADFTVDLYDNGEIDGDSISLFFNGRLLLSHKRLSDKALTLKLHVDETKTVNELIMYAENLGTIPPNTALMVVNDGDNRYEVRISSDLEKSGVIRFIHKPKIRQ